MGVPARLVWTVLAVAAAMQPERALAAAADRFVPATPGYVVADLRASQPDEPLRRLHARWRGHPDESAALALASALVERARSARAPGLFGRAESVLQPHASRRGASAPVRRLYAQTLQFRHDFRGAAAVLGSLLRDDPRDADSRLRRAALRLTTGDFDGARGDCVQLIAAGSALSGAGFACLAEALAARGELPRARTFLSSISEGTSLDAGLLAYLLSTRAGLAERAGDAHAAIADYGRALELAPNDDAIRAALSDVLRVSGDTAGARRVLDIDQPSLALLVRAAALEQGDARAVLIRRVRDWIALEAARGDAPHEREVALLEIAAGAPAAALVAAGRNFERQRELADVRVLARAAMLANDVAARAELRQWLDNSRYQDAVTEDILHARPRG